MIAQGIKEDRRRAQEIQDRNMALQLSSQEIPTPAFPTTPATGQGHANAFSKIMASQMPNSHGQYLKREGSSFQPPPAPPMPGAYDARWDEPYAPNAYAVTPQAAFRDPRQSSFPTTQQVFPRNQLPFGTNVANRLPSHANPFAYPHQQGHPPVSGFAPLSSMYGLPGTPTLPSPGGVSLLDAIGKTNMLDYANQLDAEGNHFGDRLSSFLDHAYHDPNVTEKELDELLQNIRPDMEIPDKHRDGTPAGLKQSLYRHQELALSWMKKMEEGTNRGGILADDMGLGKTISTLALMLARPAPGRPKVSLGIWGNLTSSPADSR